VPAIAPPEAIRSGKPYAFDNKPAGAAAAAASSGAQLDCFLRPDLSRDAAGNGTHLKQAVTAALRDCLHNVSVYVPNAQAASLK
jgi:hypothetical protein